MFKHTLKFTDAHQAFDAYINGTAVAFLDTALNQFYADEAAGLCTILIQPGTTQDSVILIHYHDPELEFERRLQT